MSRIRSLSRSSRTLLRLGAGIAAIATAGCGGDSGKPNVKPGDSSTTYQVPPPPVMEDGKAVPSGKQGSMSARELRDYKRKLKGQP